MVHAALERHCAVDGKDDLQGDMRLIFTEHLVEKDRTLPFDASLLKDLKEEANVKVIQTGRISGAA